MQLPSFRNHCAIYHLECVRKEYGEFARPLCCTPAMSSASVESQGEVLQSTLDESITPICLPYLVIHVRHRMDPRPL